MRRGLSTAVLGLLVCSSSALLAQRLGGTIQFHGTPASVTSPGMNGAPRGIRASVTDPSFQQPATFGQPGVNFGQHGRFHHRVPVIAVPYYYPAYDYVRYDQPEPPQQQAPPPQVIIIKDERSSSSDDSRYGEHRFEDRDSRREPAPQIAQATPNPVAQEKPVELPMTTLVYRDGHKTEVQNYAIVGGNLIDLSKAQLMKKIPLASLNLEATRHENEENGVDFHLP